MPFTYKKATFWKEYIIYLNKCKTYNTTPDTPSQWIKFHRVQMGWSQIDLALKLGLSKKQGRYLIKDYETRGLYPPQELSMKLAKLFNVGKKYFYDEYYEFLDMDYPKIIKNYRLKNNLSKTKLATMLGTTYNNVLRWEKYQTVSRKYYNKLIQLTTKEP